MIDAVPTPHTAEAAPGIRTGGPSGRPDPGSSDEEERLPLDPRRWRRPYRVGGYRVGGATLVLAVCPMLFFGALVSFVADGTTRGLLVGLAALLLVALALRMLRVGTYVSTRGLRRVTLWRTRTVRWDQVAELGIRQEPVRVLGTPRRANGQSVHARLRGGGAALEELVSDHNADFLSRSREEDFDAAVDALTAWCRQCAPGVPVPLGR